MFPIAKIITVTKNEYDLIEDFVVYHGSIFGYENIILLDNGSDDTRVLDVYERYKPLGITIQHTYGYFGNKQGEHFTNAMLSYRGSAEFVIGLDTDCFFTINGSTDKTHILHYLQSLPKDSDIFVVRKFFQSYVDTNNSSYKDGKYQRPTECKTYAIRTGSGNLTNLPHVFFRASNFVSTENGNHNGITLFQRYHECREIVYVHYHHTGKTRDIERCRAILLGYGFIHPNQSVSEQIHALENQRNGAGIHRQRQYIQYLKDTHTFMKEEPLPHDVFFYDGIFKAIQNKI